MNKEERRDMKDHIHKTTLSIKDFCTEKNCYIQKKVVIDQRILSTTHRST